MVEIIQLISYSLSNLKKDKQTNKRTKNKNIKNICGGSMLTDKWPNI